MITWKKYVPSANTTVTASEMGDGSTGNVWRGIEVDATSLPATFSVVLPLAARSTGRLITIFTKNPSGKVVGFARTSPNVICNNGSEVSTLTTTVDNVMMTVICDGTRWTSLAVDANWIGA